MNAPQRVCPIAIGLGLTLIHLVIVFQCQYFGESARSTGPALFVGDWAVSQLWLFWVAPIVGAILAIYLSLLPRGRINIEDLTQQRPLGAVVLF